MAVKSQWGLCSVSDAGVAIAPACGSSSAASSWSARGLMEAINVDARLARLFGRPVQHEHVINTLTIFCRPFVVSAVGVFASIFRALVLVDYIEMVRRPRAWLGCRDHGGGDMGCSGSRNCSKNDAFCVLNRGD